MQHHYENLPYQSISISILIFGLFCFYGHLWLLILLLDHFALVCSKHFVSVYHSVLPDHKILYHPYSPFWTIKFNFLLEKYFSRKFSEKCKWKKNIIQIRRNPIKWIRLKTTKCQNEIWSDSRSKWNLWNLKNKTSYIVLYECYRRHWVSSTVMLVTTFW